MYCIHVHVTWSNDMQHIGDRSSLGTFCNAQLMTLVTSVSFTMCMCTCASSSTFPSPFHTIGILPPPPRPLPGSLCTLLLPCMTLYVFLANYYEYSPFSHLRLSLSSLYFYPSPFSTLSLSCPSPLPPSLPSSPPTPGMTSQGGHGWH